MIVEPTPDPIDFPRRRRTLFPELRSPTRSLSLKGREALTFDLIADLIRNLLRITRMRFRLGGRNERSSESRVKLAWAMPSRDDIAESNEG